MLDDSNHDGDSTEEHQGLVSGFPEHLSSILKLKKRKRQDKLERRLNILKFREHKLSSNNPQVLAQNTEKIAVH